MRHVVEREETRYGWSAIRFANRTVTVSLSLRTVSSTDSRSYHTAAVSEEGPKVAKFLGNPSVPIRMDFIKEFYYRSYDLTASCFHSLAVII